MRQLRPPRLSILRIRIRLQIITQLLDVNLIQPILNPVHFVLQRRIHVTQLIRPAEIRQRLLPVLHPLIQIRNLPHHVDVVRILLVLRRKVRNLLQHLILRRPNPRHVLKLLRILRTLQQ